MYILRNVLCKSNILFMFGVFDFWKVNNIINDFNFFRNYFLFIFLVYDLKNDNSLLVVRIVWILD